MGGGGIGEVQQAHQLEDLGGGAGGSFKPFESSQGGRRCQQVIT